MWPVDLPIQDQKAMPTPPRAEPAPPQRPTPSSLEQAYPGLSAGGLTPKSRKQGQDMQSHFLTPSSSTGDI